MCWGFSSDPFRAVFNHSVDHFLANIIPSDRAAAYFGFYNMIGKFAALLGPVLMGTVARLSGEPRLGALAVAILFLLGGACLLKVSPQSTAIANDP